jgi:hypothetical protein
VIRWFRFMVKALPALLLASQVIAPLYNWVRPWPVATEQLSLLRATASMCVGFGSRTLSSGGETGLTQNTRTYVLVSPRRYWPRIVSIEGVSGVRVAVTEWGTLGFPTWLLLLAVCGWGVWKWWIVPYLSHGREGVRLAT